MSLLQHPLILASAALAALWLWRRRPRSINLADRCVLITGASSGLGKALASLAHKSGARVILLARSIDRLAELADELARSHPQSPKPVYRFLDLADAATPFGDVVRECLKEAGADRVDLLINNAGLSVRAACSATSMDVHRRLMEINYFGTVALTQACLPLLAEKGRILVISSVQGRIAIPHRSAYSASKHALQLPNTSPFPTICSPKRDIAVLFQAYFDSLRAELAASGVTVSVASPGYIATELSRNALTGSGALHGALDANNAGGLHPDVAARSLLSATLAGDPDILLADTKTRLALLLRTLAPTLYHSIMARRAATA